MICFFDTETTGIYNRAQPHGSPMQPHICQLGAQLCTESGRIVAEMNLLVRPNNWSVPAEAEAIHGISTELCQTYGLPIATVIKLFAQFVRRARLVAAHNFPFDQGMAWTEFVRCEAATELALFLGCPSFCTMQTLTSIMKLPGRSGSFKWPNLQEAHEFICGSRFEGGHDAMADVNALRRVFFGMQKAGYLDLAALTVVPPLVEPAAPAESCEV